MSLPIQQHIFAYNTGSPISGTIQVGDLAISDVAQQYSTDIGGVKWWGGPNENNGYVIAAPVSGGTQPTPIIGVNSFVSFYQTPTISDGQFIILAQDVSNVYGNPQTFTAATDASTWLTTNGFWNSYGAGGWYLYNSYTDAGAQGSITFPNHGAGQGSLNPNLVGQILPGNLVQLYINVVQNNGTNQYSTLSQLPNNYGTLTLSQGSNVVKYSFTNNGFQIGYGGDEVFSDNYYENSVPGSITVLQLASSDFNTTDLISISQSIFPSGYTFTIDSSMLNGLASVGNAQYASPNGTAGFTVSQQINNLSYGVYGQLNDTTGIASAFTAAGATAGGSGYIVMVQWGSGSDYQEGIAKVSYNSFAGQFIVTSVDSLDNDFTSPNNNAGSNLVGTFNFPATFTFITPLIPKTDWC